MSKLREAARGMQCMMRLPGVCNFDESTTVLAHLNMTGISGRGIKAPDLLGAWCCSECHRCETTNGQSHGLERDYVRMAFFEAIFRTQYCLLQKDLIKG